MKSNNIMKNTVNEQFPSEKCVMLRFCFKGKMQKMKNKDIKWHFLRNNFQLHLPKLEKSGSFLVQKLMLGIKIFFIQNDLNSSPQHRILFPRYNIQRVVFFKLKRETEDVV